MDEKRLSIYVIERDYGSYFHSFLALVDETTPSDFPEIVEQLHFNDNVYDCMHPELVEGFRPSHHKRLGDFSFYPYIGGKERDMLPMWNHILKWAADIRKVPLRFESGTDSPYAVNCRAGVKAAIKTIGIEFFEEFTRSSIGARAHSPSHGAPFSHDNAPTDIVEIRETHQVLAAVLK